MHGIKSFFFSFKALYFVILKITDLPLWKLTSSFEDYNIFAPCRISDFHLYVYFLSIYK